MNRGDKKGRLHPAGSESVDLSAASAAADGVAARFPAKPHHLPPDPAPPPAAAAAERPMVEITSSRARRPHRQAKHVWDPDAGWMALPQEVWESNDPAAACVILTITPGDTEIGQYAFNRLHCIHTVILPASLERIGPQAFWNCKGLVHVQFAKGGGLKAVGQQAFCGCERLKHVAIPEGTTAIHGGAFSGCTSLRTVELPSTLTSPLGSTDPSGFQSNVLGDHNRTGRVFSSCALLREVTVTGGCHPAAAMAVIEGSAHHTEPLEQFKSGGPNFHECPQAMIVLKISIWAVTGDRFSLDVPWRAAWPDVARQAYGIIHVQAYQEFKIGTRFFGPPWQPPRPADLHTLLSDQHPGSDVAGPRIYELIGAEVGSADANVPLSPSIRGAAGAAGLLRLFQGELDLGNIFVSFLTPEAIAAAVAAVAAAEAAEAAENVAVIATITARARAAREEAGIAEATAREEQQHAANMAVAISESLAGPGTTAISESLAGPGTTAAAITAAHAADLAAASNPVAAGDAAGMSDLESEPEDWEAQFADSDSEDEADDVRPDAKKRRDD